jgi:hypothetical protein
MKGFKEVLQESSLSRIWRHTQDHVSGAISGYRGDNSKDTNKQNNREIKAYLRTKGYSVTSVSGNYIENFGSDDAREVGEPSFFVVDINDTGNLERDLVRLGVKYDQDSVLIVPKGGKDAYLRGTTRRSNGPLGFNQTMVVGKGTYGKVAGQFLSRIRGREFAFEEVRPPLTRNGKWAESKLAEMVEESLPDID